MAKGENIFKRKDGRWEARYIKDYELSGKIKYGYCYGRPIRRQRKRSPESKRPLQAASRRRFLIPAIGLRIFAMSGLSLEKADSRNPPV